VTQTHPLPSSIRIGVHESGAAPIVSQPCEHCSGDIRAALIEYMAAVGALGAKSVTDPSRVLFDERPMSDEGMAAWQKLDAAGKQAFAALAKVTAA
jgi:hypothetical protein